MKKTLIYTLAFAGLVSIADARSFRVNQIPNGSKNGCITCHNSSSGGSRNSFGKAIENNFLNGGDVVWGAQLAARDDDGDGFSNGEELQDPNGAWQIGQANPGDASKVTNPGNAGSKPTYYFEEKPEFYGISNIEVFPNPAVSFQSLAIELGLPGTINAEIYSINGALVKTVANTLYPAGKHIISWNLTNSLSSGNYYLKITFNGGIFTYPLSVK